MTGTTAGTVDRTDYYYYYVKGERVPLVREPSVYAVRLARSVRDDSRELSTASRRLLQEESQELRFIANYGLRILRRRTSERSDDQLAAIRRLDAEEGVEQAVAAYRNAGSEELMFTTRRFVVQFRPDVDRRRIDAYNAAHGVRLTGPATYLVNGFVLEAPAGEGERGPVTLANTYVESGLAVSATPDFVRRVHTRSAPSKARAKNAAPASVEAPADEPRAREATRTRQSARAGGAASARRRPGGAVTARGGEFLSRQWHLETARVVDAWDVTTGDSSIVVAVLDDGVDVDHVEFAGKVVGQMDFADQVSDARPKAPTDNHGTACAGVAVATGVKAHGAAPGCSLLAVRTPEYLGVADEAEMFRWVCDAGADVISCSWGPQDGTGAEDPLPDNVRGAIRYCVTNGRQGKGIPVLWAAGNGNESLSLDGYAANPDVMAIAASTRSDARSWYSDFGPEVWVCAPSSGASASGDPRVFTTDRTGGEGYNPGDAGAGDADGDYTNDFGGTSSSTPLVAGVVGLLLSVDPTLTHRQVRDVLRRTASKIGGTTSYDASGHSDHYGYGRVDARAAVDAVVAGDTGSGEETPNERPGITAPSEASRSGTAPAFSVTAGPGRLYAVEVATRWQLFDVGHDDERTPETFHASWETGPLLTDPAYVLPEDAWQRLRHESRLYYRVHTALDTDWTGWLTSTPDEEAASAPSISVTAGDEPAGPEPGRGDEPSISAPATVARHGAPPVFAVRSAGQLYAVEVATRSELFDGANEADRSDDSFYGSWQDQPLQTVSTWELPTAPWLRLQASDRLHYRLHTADDTDWNGWAVTVPDKDAASAPFLSLKDGDAGGPGTGTGTVDYPSATFDSVSTPDDGIDYADPVAGGEVPLIEVRDRLDDRLSPNFRVQELAARRVGAAGEFAGYARIAPELVRGLQAMREALGVPVTVHSCYRYPALNQDVDGAGQSQHMAGRAADVSASGMTPLEVARTALQVMGSDIGLGLGRGSLHVDVRGDAASWVYDGAAMTEGEFDDWVRRTAADLGRSRTRRREGTERTRPSITGPSTLDRTSGPPAFAVSTGPFPYVGVEVADDWRLLARAPRAGGSTAPGHVSVGLSGGLRPVGAQGSVTFELAESDWAALRSADRVYYRAVCGWTESPEDGVVSAPPERAEDAPSILLVGGGADRSDGVASQVEPTVVARRRDEARWRGEPAAGRQ